MSKLLSFSLGLLILLASGLATCAGADAEPAAGTAETNSQDSLRAYLLLQEQIHATQLSIDRNRRETDAAAARNAEALASRLENLEKFLADQRKGELDTMQSSNHVLLLIGSIFGGIAVVMLLMGFFQWRTIQRLTSLPALQRPGGLSVEASAVAQLAAGTAAEASNQRLLGTLDRLERRLLELEHHTQPALANGDGAADDAPVTLGANGHTNGHANPRATGPNGAATAAKAEPASRVQQLLEKGQSFLDLSEPKDALACFEEVLTMEPANAEALVKKGSTLERLQKPDEAIECYDRAIAADDSFTIAYLHKGGLFNRLERFSEALECYKLALRTQK